MKCLPGTALTDSTAENGCMRVIPRSHGRPLAHVERHARGNMLSRGQELAEAIDERDAVDVELRAGQMSLHHINLVHGSCGNGTSRSARPCSSATRRPWSARVTRRSPRGPGHRRVDGCQGRDDAAVGIR